MSKGKSILGKRILQLLLTHWKPLKWLDLEVRDMDWMCLDHSSVFSGRDQVKKSAQLSMALPPAQPLVELWKYKEFSALGSNDVDDMIPIIHPCRKDSF